MNRMRKVLEEYARETLKQAKEEGGYLDMGSGQYFYPSPKYKIFPRKHLILFWGQWQEDSGELRRGKLLVQVDENGNYINSEGWLDYQHSVKRLLLNKKQIEAKGGGK